MSDFIDAADPRFAFIHGDDGPEVTASPFPDFCEDFESLSIPNRGMVLAVTLSSVLWAAIILAGRGLWLLLR